MFDALGLGLFTNIVDTKRDQCGIESWVFV